MTPKSRGEAQRRRTYRATRIPEPLHSGIRHRLRTLRLAKNMSLIDYHIMAPGTMGSYENEDISTLRFGDLIAIGSDFGMEPLEFIGYLLGDDAIIARTGPAKNLDEISIYLRDANPETQDLCVAAVRALVMTANKLARETPEAAQVAP